MVYDLPLQFYWNHSLSIQSICSDASQEHGKTHELQSILFKSNVFYLNCSVHNCSLIADFRLDFGKIRVVSGYTYEAYSRFHLC